MPWLPTKRHKLPRLHVKKQPVVTAVDGPSPVDIRSSQRWRRLSVLVRSVQPICRDPFGRHFRAGVLVPSAEVHHIEPLIERPDLAFDRANLVALCSFCHSAIESRHNAGEATRHLLK